MAEPLPRDSVQYLAMLDVALDREDVWLALYALAKAQEAGHDARRIYDVSSRMALRKGRTVPEYGAVGPRAA